MARKRRDIAVWGVMVAGVLLCAGVIGYVLSRPPRLVPVLRNVDGKDGNTKHWSSVGYYWLTPDSVLVWRREDKIFVRFDLRTGTETVMRQYPDTLLGVSPDGRYMIGTEPDPPRGNSSAHNRLIAVAVDGTGTRTWDKARDLFFLPAIYWTRDGNHWFLNKATYTSGMTPPLSRLFRGSLSDLNAPLKPVTIQTNALHFLGMDDRNRLFAWDADATRGHAQNGTVQFGRGYHSSVGLVSRQGIVSHLAAAAFPLESDAEGTAPLKPVRFLVRLPPVTITHLTFILSPDGRKVAWMTRGRDPLPSWLSWLQPIYYRWKPSQTQLWVSDLSDDVIRQDAPPRLVFSMDGDPLKGQRVVTNQRQISSPRDLAWMPDSNHLTFLNDNTLWRVDAR